MIRKIELFFRGEFWLHLATMFFCMVMLIQLTQLIGIHLPVWFLLPLPLVVGTVWEILWKIYKQKPIDILDILGTVIGGVLALTLLRFI